MNQRLISTLIQKRCSIRIIYFFLFVYFHLSFSLKPMEIQPAADADHLFLDSPIPPIKLPLDDTHKRTHHATKAVPKLKGI